MRGGNSGDKRSPSEHEGIERASKLPKSAQQRSASIAAETETERQESSSSGATRAPALPSGGYDATAVRTKGIAMLGTALQDPSPLFDTACAVEAAVFQHYGEDINKEYRARIRTLKHNLQANKELREAILQKDVSPQELCTMPAKKLAAAARKQERDAMEASVMRRATVRMGEKEISTSSYQCGDCGSKECVYVTLIGARDIGKSETWGSKDKGEDGMLITCKKCAHQWRREL